MSSEFQRGDDIFKTRHYAIFHAFLRHIFLLPVEIRYTCLTEARRLSPPLDNSMSDEALICSVTLCGNSLRSQQKKTKNVL